MAVGGTLPTVEEGFSKDPRAQVAQLQQADGPQGSPDIAQSDDGEAPTTTASALAALTASPSASGSDPTLEPAELDQKNGKDSSTAPDAAQAHRLAQPPSESPAGTQARPPSTQNSLSEHPQPNGDADQAPERPESPPIEPRERFEWQNMLTSVLRGDVLRSETTRISSVDARVLTREETMYRRWLEVRAALRGRRGPMEMEKEEKRLKNVGRCRAEEVLAAVKAFGEEDKEKASRLERSGEVAGGQKRNGVHADEGAAAALVAGTSGIFHEVSQLLDRVDEVENLFPTSKKMLEIVPEWGEAAVQKKLAALYSWYSVTTSLQLQVSILQKWTGNADLDIERHITRDDEPVRRLSDGGRVAFASFSERGKMEQTTFVERILKEGSLQSTFERRTLRALSLLARKAKSTIKSNSPIWNRLRLPSFEPDLLKLVNFPTKLMEGALKLRLDYAGKLKEPNIVIVDSLIEDFRTSIALACRIKKEYLAIIEPDPDAGWDLPPCIDEQYDAVLRDALRFFFKLLNFKLKGGTQYKEAEVFESEWMVLSTAVEVIDGGDLIVAEQITSVVNKLLVRLGSYFQRDLAAPSNVERRPLPQAAPGRPPLPPGQSSRLGRSGPSAAGGVNQGRVRMTHEEKQRWIQTLYDNVRIRVRKMLGFARDICHRLSNAAEYDLSTADLAHFMNTLVDADYFLVYTETFEENGIYVIAEPSLQDKPELVRQLLTKCIRRLQAADERDTTTLKRRTVDDPAAHDAAGAHDGQAGNVNSADEAVDLEGLHYLLLMSPRDPFLWTGRIMNLEVPPVDIDLKDRRVRLIADGPKKRLRLAKEHFYALFTELDRGQFPLETIREHTAHISTVRMEIKRINRNTFKLCDTLIRSVPRVQMAMRGSPNGQDVIEFCFSMVSEQGQRVLPYIESKKLQNRLSLGLIKVAINWVAFITDDCVPTDRKTFKWAVAALENIVIMTRGDNILNLKEAEFDLLRSKVASCMSLLISHFDIMGARSSFEAKKERERLDRERAERERLEMALGKKQQSSLEAQNSSMRGAAPDATAVGNLKAMVSKVAGGGVVPQPSVDPAYMPDKSIRLQRERWLQKVAEWNQARQEIELEQRLIGRVMDETRAEDRGLLYLVSSGSRVQIRWQQGRFIGGGTFGSVYLAVNLDSGVLMAVKEIRFQDISTNPGLLKQIKDEMSVMEMLHHANIVEYYGIEVHRDKVYIFEEYCQGGSLAQLLEHGRIEDEAVIQIYTLQMLEGLMYLHSKNVIHRDIKPENILLDHRGVIKFVDFGAAKVISKNARTIHRTIQRTRKGMGLGMGHFGGAGGMLGPDGKPAAGAMGSLTGTPMYMSPEVIKGDTRGKPGAMDIWALGCVVLECATGRKPWSQLDNEWAIMFHIGIATQHPPLPQPGELSAEGIDFIRQCLTLDPDKRPTAVELMNHPWISSLREQLAAAYDEEVADEEQYYAYSDSGSLISPSAFSPIDSGGTSGSLRFQSNSIGSQTGAAFQGLMTPYQQSSDSSEVSLNRSPMLGAMHTAEQQEVSAGPSASAAAPAPVPASHHPNFTQATLDPQSAAVADEAYRQEEEHTRAMMTNSPPESGIITPTSESTLAEVGSSDAIGPLEG